MNTRGSAKVASRRAMSTFSIMKHKEVGKLGYARAGSVIPIKSLFKQTCSKFFLPAAFRVSAILNFWVRTVLRPPKVITVCHCQPVRINRTSSFFFPVPSRFSAASFRTGLRNQDIHIGFRCMIHIIHSTLLILLDSLTGVHLHIRQHHFQ